MPRKHTTAKIIESARKVHGDKYDYSKVVYRDIHTKICIICPEHGEFWQEPNNHISRKSICPKCAQKLKADNLRMPAEEFVRKASLVHKGKYDYSKVEYHHTDDKVCIICPEHGEFWQVPHNHLHGFGCPKCSGKYVPSTEEFIAEAKARHGDNFDYSKTVYRGTSKKVCIICPTHGEFWQSPNNHLNQNGCPRCNGNYGIDKEYFIKKSTERFEGKYDYSKVEWKGYRRNVKIICPIHGEFLQSPIVHLKSLGCPKCSGTFMDQDFFIEKSKIIHGEKYDYSKVVYKGNKTPVCIICPKHGEFFQKPNGHLRGHGCKKCYAEETSIRLRKTEEEFLAAANEKHNGKYDYSQMQYVDRSTPIRIICAKHGSFFQIPKNHLHGSGCPMCNSSVLEDIVAKTLKRHNIQFVPQKTFDWLKHKGVLSLDFYLPDYNIAIECQGIQHFKPIDFWGGDNSLEQAKKRDALKKQLCEEKGIKVLYFSNLGIKYPYPVIEDTSILLQAILSKGTSDKPLWQPDPELPFTY